MATYANFIGQFNNLLIAQLNATGAGRFAQSVFMVGTMEVNKSVKGVLLSASIKPFLQSV